MWDTMRIRNLGIIGIVEKGESQINCKSQIFNRITEENFPKLRKDLPIKIQEAHRPPNRQGQKRNSL